MTKNGRRILALAIGMALAGGAAALVLSRRSAPGPIGVVDQTASVEEVLLERQVAPRGLGPFELRPGLAGLPREPVDEATALKIFPIAPEFMQWDPIQYFRYKPHLAEVIQFPQHAGGTYRRVTNGDGYREDAETRADADVLVLATGDSHTDGIGDNTESWPSGLERLLAAARPGSSVEVVNAGVQNYSFYQYLASVERALPLGPDAVVTLCYGGNDFMEVLLLHHLFQHTVRPTRTAEYWETLKKAKGVYEPELTQILYEALYFDRFPDQVDRALAASSAVCAEIQRVCAEKSVPWVFAYLPSVYCVPWKELADERARDLAALKLDTAALARVDAVADRLLAILRERGVTVVDLREPLRAMAARGEPRPYWDEFHIDVRGAEMVARWLQPSVEAALSGRR